MPDPAYTAALKEAMASAPNGVVILHTIELEHPSLEEHLYLVQDYVSHDCTLENGGGVKTFLPAPFRFTLPATGVNGLQELNIGIDNVDQAVSDFLAQLEGNPEPVKLKYRTYLNTAKSAPQNGKPLTLFLSDISVNQVEVTGRAAFANIINRPFLFPLYNVREFPGLK